MVWYKSCPRCSGDVVEKMSLDGLEKCCIQCGYRPRPIDVLDSTGNAKGKVNLPVWDSHQRKKFKD